MGALGRGLGGAALAQDDSTWRWRGGTLKGLPVSLWVVWIVVMGDQWRVVVQRIDRGIGRSMHFDLRGGIEIEIEIKHASYTGSELLGCSASFARSVVGDSRQVKGALMHIHASTAALNPTIDPTTLHINTQPLRKQASRLGLSAPTRQSSRGSDRAGC